MLQVLHQVALGADETLLEICMDNAGALRRGEAAVNGPRTNFLGASREITLQAKQVVGRARHGGKRGLIHSKACQHFRAVGFSKFR